MKQSTLIIVGIIVLVFGAVAAYALLGNNSQNEMTKIMDGSDTSMEQKAMDQETGEAMMTDNDSMMIANDTSMMIQDERYTALMSDTLNKTADARRVLFFYANWCPTCQPVNDELRDNMDQIPDDLTVIRVNYNDPETDEEEKDLARKYGVTYQHTFVQIDEDGNEVAKWNGGGLEQLLSKVE